MSIQAINPALYYGSRAPEEEPLRPEVNRPFYFEDSQVVLQASHCITGLPYYVNRLFTLYRWKDRRTKSIVIS